MKFSIEIIHKRIDPDHVTTILSSFRRYLCNQLYKEFGIKMKNKIKIKG